jgi:hypothetical protein
MPRWRRALGTRRMILWLKLFLEDGLRPGVREYQIGEANRRLVGYSGLNRDVANRRCIIGR